MSMIEFQSYVQHGTIHIPLPYRESLIGRVRVIILMDDDPDESDMIDMHCWIISRRIGHPSSFKRSTGTLER